MTLQREHFGKAVGLHGYMATVCVFKGCLQDNHIGRIFTQGSFDPLSVCTLLTLLFD